MMAFASLALAGCGGPTSKTGIDLANLDQTAKPGDNFYQYACGGWIKAHPLTGEYSTYGNFEVLIENNNKQLRGLIEAMAKGQHEVGTLEQKIGDLYNIAMDSVKQNKDGYAPIKEDMDAIAAIQDRKEIIALRLLHRCRHQEQQHEPPSNHARRFKLRRERVLSGQ